MLKTPDTVSIWETLRSRIALGEPVSEGQLLFAMDREPTPKDLEDFVFRTLSTPRPRGRPMQTREERAARLGESVELGTEMRLRQVGFRRQKLSDPRGRAIGRVARVRDYKPETVRERIVKELSQSPRAKALIPELDEAERLMDEMLEAGLVRLDPREGCVRCSSDELLADTALSPDSRSYGARKGGKDSK